MRKSLLVALALLTSGIVMAQSDSTVKRGLLTPRSLPKGNDHLMVQFGVTQWMNRPDSLNTGGISRSLNLYFMINFPFRTNPRLSAAIGVGVGSDNIFLKETDIRIRDVASSIAFRDVSDTNHFKKTKLTTDYLEVPVELRYSAKPEDDAHSLKFAIGVKVGALLQAKVKNKELQNAADQAINDFKEKQYSKRFFNSNRLVATARIGYGHFSLFGAYQLSRVFRENMGPDVRPLSIGLSISGL
ncbi:outer membrane beta-barrel protein [Flaviaesturariibacter amylovorans]|uniref:Outer membrane protein beta-barrel domain-containing protein n=1 Tax=Flaviaesturariibacter amylovorans TaxID=1084520 RepID=A0ABP8HKR2_9BACT